MIHLKTFDGQAISGKLIYDDKYFLHIKLADGTVKLIAKYTIAEGY